MEYTSEFEQLIRHKTMDRLHQHLEYAKQQGYNEENILGIFCYGSQNYHFANRDSDIDSKLIILPTFEDICLHEKWESKELHFEDEHIEVKDIRELRLMFMKQNINFLEILYTDYFILNPKYEELWNQYFVSNREDITHYDIDKTVKSISGQIKHTLSYVELDNKKIYNAWRLTYFLDMYLQGKDYIDCIRPQGIMHSTLSLIKNSNSVDIEGAKQGIYELLDRVLDKDAGVAHELRTRAAAIMEEGVMQIIYSSIVNPTINISKKEFFEHLTNAERKAYEAIIDEIGYEGNITISRLVEQTCISRPVYNNLITKMKELKVATVQNMGMKGTYIKITNPNLKS
jgi:predicted nucleotidyltransferase